MQRSSASSAASRRFRDGGSAVLPRKQRGIGRVQKIYLFVLAAFLFSRPAAVDASSFIYEDGFDDNWQNRSWDTAVDMRQTGVVARGQYALGARHVAAWAGLYIDAVSPVDTAAYQALQFSLHGSSGNQTVNLIAVDGDGNWLRPLRLRLDAGRWREFRIPLSDLGSPVSLGGLIWQNGSNGPQQRFYIDDIPADRKRPNIRPYPVCATLSPRGSVF